MGNVLIQPTEKVCLLSFLKSDNDMNVKRLVLWHFFNMMLCTLDLVPRPTLITSITNANIGTEIKCACGINVERTCRCQGTHSLLAGQSYTWGCSNSIYCYDLCLFSQVPDPAEV